MARRRARSRKPARGGGNLLLWVVVMMVAGATGWIWWRAAYPDPESRPVENLLADWFPAATGKVATAATTTAGNTRTSPPRAAVSRTNLPPPRPEPAAPMPPARVEPPQPVTVVNLATTAPPAETRPTPPRRPPENVFTPEQIIDAQIALARRGFSSGSIDGVLGAQTRAAIRAFQEVQGLPITGTLDAATSQLLTPVEPRFTFYIVTDADLARLTPVPPTWFGKSTRERLDYETILELVAEKNRAHPNLIQQLNPDINWNTVTNGAIIRVPNVEAPSIAGKAAWAHIKLGEKRLRAFKSSGELLVHFPCSIAQRVEKRPVGQLRVSKIALHPNYQFDPEIFQESEEARSIGRKLTLPPGPNNPVGTAWIGLDRPGYGIHGTPTPEAVGRTESHGCFRLANWDAEVLLNLVWIGMPVHVEP